ncbi:phosphoadenosine phosphosulfate reductase family protein [Myxococcota bacterium]|nr:phosphoadenosine phosphosulfate reductase family protein [Myxococcota bacterium]
MATMKEALESISDPTMRHIVSISGGKDSAALALHIRMNYPQIPAEYVFCDTGCELPETYEYLEKLETLLGIQIKRVNALDTLKIKQKPGRNPFDVWLQEMYGGFLPSPRMRWCTKVLKIKPFEDYVGETYAFSYIGIRADENREGYVSQKKPPVLSQRPNIVPVYPFKDDNMGLEDIKNLLESSGLGLPEYYKWRSRSGCYFCFYQQLGEWQGLKENHPDLFEQAKKYETKKNGKRFTWVDGRPLEELERMPRRETIPKDEEAEGCAICHI